MCVISSLLAPEEGAELRQEDACTSEDGVKDPPACFGKSPREVRFPCQKSTSPFSFPLPRAGFRGALGRGSQLRSGSAHMGLLCWARHRSCEPPGPRALSGSKSQQEKSLQCISLRANEHEKAGLVWGESPAAACTVISSGVKKLAERNPRGRKHPGMINPLSPCEDSPVLP